MMPLDRGVKRSGKIAMQKAKLLLRTFGFRSLVSMVVFYNFFVWFLRFLFFLIFNFNESCKLPEETIKYIWSPMFCGSKKQLRLCDNILCQRLLVFLWKVRLKFVAHNSCLCNWVITAMVYTVPYGLITCFLWGPHEASRLGNLLPRWVKKMKYNPIPRASSAFLISKQ